jgi:hypothetical protein
MSVSGDYFPPRNLNSHCHIVGDDRLLSELECLELGRFEDFLDFPGALALVSTLGEMLASNIPLPPRSL